jgi:2-polyprenyl-3-methyl-5-hydroxy-6-metoxy-1,4-benzoquinol methylase
MTHEPAEKQSISKDFWDQRYREEPGYLYGETPNAYLASRQRWLRPGMCALSIADGEGRNGVWLAEQGLEVLAVDQSSVGLGKAVALAKRRGVTLGTACVDLAEWAWPAETFDLVISVFAHFGPLLRPEIHRGIMQALKPGGMVILQAFGPDQHDYESGGPHDAALLYSADDLRADFAGLEILELEEYLGELEEGEHHRGPAALVGLVARKPIC